jgi:glycosyltransferase involved in cell wall biosynthesis
VQVLTALPNYPGHAVLQQYVGRKNTVEMFDGIRVARVGLYVPKKKTFAGRLKCYLTFAWNARFQGIKLLSKADLLFMESPPLFLALAGVPLAKRLEAKLITNISDLWPRSAVELGIIKPGALLWAAERLESWMYRSSDLITCQTQGILDDIKKRFPSKRVELFSNGVDLDSYTRPQNRLKLRKEFGWKSGSFVVGYTGVLGHAQALDQVLDAALLLGGVTEIHFALFGAGPCKDHLEERISKEKISSVKLYPHQPRDRMPGIQMAMDAGLVPLAKGRTFEGARPSKMFEIMAAAKPMILCANGEAVRIMNGSEWGATGVVAPPEEPQELARQIMRLATERKEANEMGRRGRKYVLATFDRNNIAHDLEKLFLELVNSKVRVM